MGDKGSTNIERRSLLRTSVLAPLVLAGSAALSGGIVDQSVEHGAWTTDGRELLRTLQPDVDEGTRIAARFDYRRVMEGTVLARVTVDGDVEPFARPSRMARIRALAPLSFREWAPVFAVSHAAVKQWADGDEPDRPKLDRVLDALSAASIHHDLNSWLVSPLPGMEARPLDLLRDDRWRAFRGAIRARTALAVNLSPEELIDRRRAQASWVIAEPPIVLEEA